MERQYIKQMKSNYVEWLNQNNQTARTFELANNKIFKPILNYTPIHPEDKGNSAEINQNIQEIIRDIDILQSTFGLAGYKSQNLLNSTNSNINTLLSKVNKEYERLEDFGYLINKYDKFNSIKECNINNFSGSYSVVGHYVAPKIGSSKTVGYKIIDIEGNGYEGNKYIYNNNRFDSTIMDTSDRDFIKSDNDINYYEYSRLNSNKKLKQDFSLINYDNVPVRCSISVKTKEFVNSFDVNTFGNDIILKDILISTTGLEYKSVIEDSITINNISSKKNNVITFPLTKYIKLILESTYTPNDIIAIQYHNENIKKFYEVKRSTIRLNNLTFYKNTYAKHSNYIETNIYTENATAIAVYSNEIIPYMQSAESNPFEYTLIINGNEFEITPINTNRDGIKLIKTIDGRLNYESILNIREEIKSIKLRILIKSDSSDSIPLINNIKILLSRSL